MKQVFFAVPCFLLLHTALNAASLSFTDRNKDELCGESPYCSQVQIRRDEIGSLSRGGAIPNTRMFTLRALITLYPNIGSGDESASVAQKTAGAKTVDVDVVVETGDQIKHTYTKRNVPIRFEGKGENASRYCEVEFGIPYFEIVAVHAIDANEKDGKGNVVFHHRFR